MPRGRVGVAADCKETLQDGALFRGHAGAGTHRRLFEKPIGDFAGAAAADFRDPGDRQQVFDQRFGAGVVGALQRRQNARLAAGAVAVFRQDRL